jgi:predicted deacetylase
VSILDSDKRKISIFLLLIVFIVLNTIIFIKLKNIEEKTNEIYNLKSEINELNNKITRINSTINYKNKTAVIIIRVDDVRDFYATEATRFLIQFNRISKIKMDIGIIPAQFGKDNETVSMVKTAIKEGSEIIVHGFNHENVTEIDTQHQTELLKSAKEKLQLMNLSSTIYAPPFFIYNKGTFEAMKKNGLNTITDFIDKGKANYTINDIYRFPATVTTSDLVNGVWKMKDLDQLEKEVTIDIGTYGYSMIVIHPQEFIIGEKLETSLIQQYIDFIQNIQNRYSFTTISEYKKNNLD